MCVPWWYNHTVPSSLDEHVDYKTNALTHEEAGLNFWFGESMDL